MTAVTPGMLDKEPWLAHRGPKSMQTRGVISYGACSLLKNTVHFPDGRPLWQKWLRGARSAFIFAAAYCLADIALNRFAFSDGWTIIWPLNGVTVALLLMRPRSTWLAMMLGLEVGTAIGECLDGNSLVLELGQRVCSAIEVLLTAALLPPFSTLERWLRTPRIFARFSAALIVGPGISGLLAALMFSYTEGQSFLLAFNNWGTADALGIAATMPLILSLRSPQMNALFQRAALARTLGILALAFSGATLIFCVSRYPLLFLLYPILLLVDSLLAFAGSAITVVGVCLISIYCTTNSLGPFGQWPSNLPITRDLALQMYFGFHMMALFPASIMFMERKRLADELRSTNARLTVLASLDGLTGIANRRSFDTQFAEEWQRSMQVGSPLALAIIDLDHFKQFNDLYGHLAGDHCLRTVADALAAQIRQGEGSVARFGGEEFALLLPDTNAEAIQRIAERVRAAIFALALEHNANPWDRVTVSIGYAYATPTQSDQQSSLVQLADAALYQAKRFGRNRAETISSMEGLEAAQQQVGESSKIRLLRLLGRK